MPTPLRLAIAGLGRIAASHVAALERTPGVELVAGADPGPSARLAFRGRDLPVVRDAAALPPVDAAVVTVPTGAHLAALRDLAAAGVPEVLMEKPLVANREELDALDDARGGARVWPLLHFALADEVRWAAERIGAWTAAHGPVAEVLQLFQDPYLPHLDERLRSLSSSWLDSGVNALSVAARLAPLGPVRAARPLGAPAGTGAAVELDLEGGGTAGLVTSWHARRTSKGTHLRLAGGARVLIDHTAGSGLLLEPGGGVADAFLPADDGLDSMTSHYMAVYADWREHRAGAAARLDAGRELVARVLDAADLLATAPPPR
ncbi:MAG: Gfo/Idh/MocA family oxidoreductase [Thermoleophilia bacterium]